MSGFIQGEDRSQATWFPERLDDYVAEDSSVRVIDVFIDELDLSVLAFKAEPNGTGRPAYHPATMLKLFVYGYLNLLANAFVAIDGSKFKAVNNRDRNFARAKTTLAVDKIGVVADRGYYRNIEPKSREEAGITAYVPNSCPSPNQAQGKFCRDAFRYITADDEYECPAGQRLVRRRTAVEHPFRP